MLDKCEAEAEMKFFVDVSVTIELGQIVRTWYEICIDDKASPTLGRVSLGTIVATQGGGRASF
jgi:hypothetical protein